jgi:hypothetical protein
LRDSEIRRWPGRFGSGSTAWRPDSRQELGDAISLPQRVEYVAKWAVSKRAGDCDEFAIYNAATLNKSIREGKFTGDPYLREAFLMSVMWVDAGGKYGGHNVTLLERPFGPETTYHSYMDYGLPSKARLDLREVVIDVLNRYCPGGTLLGYTVYTENLKPIRSGR